MTSKFNLKQGIKKYYPLGFLFLIIFGFALIQEAKAKAISVGTASDNIGIGTDSPGTTYRLNVNGNSNITGTLNVTGGITGASLGSTLLSAGNVSAGTFGSNSGGGNYTFPGAVSASTFSGMLLGSSQWNPDGDGPDLTYDDSNPVYNGKQFGAIINFNGDAAQDGALLRTGAFEGNYFQASNGFYIGSPEANGTQIINSSGGAYFPGSVGIGTASPGAKLDVNGTTRLRGNAGMDAGNIFYFGNEESFGGSDTGGADYGYIKFDNDNNSYNYWGDSGENSALVIGTSNDGMGAYSDILVLKSTAATINDGTFLVMNGNTGLGNASPGAKLDVSGAIKQESVSKKVIYLSNGTANSGPGKWYVRLQPISSSNIASVKITVQGTWNYTPIMGWLSGEYSYYVPGDGTLNRNDFRVTSTTGDAYSNLRIGALVVENGYLSIPVWAANTNTVTVTLEYQDGSNLINNNLTSTGWMAEALPAPNVQSIQGDLSVSGTISGAMSGTLNAANLSAGTFGSNTGGGNYSFPNDVYASVFRARGSNPFYFNDYGGGWYMSDGSWIRTYNSKNVWTAGGLLGTDGGLTSGYGGATPPGGGAIIAGNVGIGTNNPTTKAYIYGTLTINPVGAPQNYSEGIRIGSSAGGYSLVQYGADTNSAVGSQTNQWWAGKDGRDNGFNIFSNQAGDTLHILSNGNVGIGTTGPGYKLDVAGGIRSRENIYTNANYGYGLVGTYDSYRYQGVFSMGYQWGLAADGSNTGNLYGLAWSHPNAGGVASNLNTHGLLVMENGTFLAAISGSIRSRDDMQSPIFYDRNDTSYYMDPNGTSRLNNVTVTGSITGNISNSDTVDGQHFSWSNRSNGPTYVWAADSNGDSYLAYRPALSVSYASSADSANKLNITGYGSSNLTYYQTSGDFDGTTGWAHYIIANHGDGASYYHYSLRLPFWGPPQYRRQTGSTSSVTPWYDFVTSENVGSYALPITGGTVSGTITANGFIYASDVKLKKNINTIDNSLAKIIQLRGVTFNWKKDNSPSVGLIAQEVEKVFPELVTEQNGIKAVQYGNLVAPLIEAVKEQQKEIQSLNERIKVLEAK